MGSLEIEYVHLKLHGSTLLLFGSVGNCKDESAIWEKIARGEAE